MTLHVVDVTLRLEGETPIIEVDAPESRVVFRMDPDLSFREGHQLRDLLRKHVRLVEANLDSVTSPSAREPFETNSQGIDDANGPDWRSYLVTCPCGREFRDSGLGGLGKHSANCHIAQAELHLARTKMTTIYKPVIQAIYEWSNGKPFSMPELRDRFEELDVSISYSAIRGHIEWLESKAYLVRIEKRGRQNYYEFEAAPTEAIEGEDKPRTSEDEVIG